MTTQHIVQYSTSIREDFKLAGFKDDSWDWPRTSTSPVGMFGLTISSGLGCTVPSITTTYSRRTRSAARWTVAKRVGFEIICEIRRDGCSQFKDDTSNGVKTEEKKLTHTTSPGAAFPPPVARRVGSEILCSDGGERWGMEDRFQSRSPIFSSARARQAHSDTRLNESRQMLGQGHQQE
jgi:hypothetical protein